MDFNVMINWSRRCLISIVAALLCFVIAGEVRSQESLRIAAVVNEEIISAYDLNARMRLIVLLSRLPNTEETYRSLAQPTLRALIDEKIKLQEAEVLGISVSQAEIDRTLGVIEQRNKMNPGALIPILQQNNIDLETLFDQIRADISWTRIVPRKHRNSVTVTEAEIDALLAADEAARNQPRYRISEIVIPVENPEKLNEATSQVKALEAQLKAGADFGALARSFSQSPSATRGGELGWMRADQILQELRPTVLALRPNQISPPMRVSTGFVVVKLHETRSGAIQAQPDAILKLSQLHLPLPGDAPQETVSSYVTTARSKTATVEGCASFDTVAKEIGSTLSGSTGTVKLSKLPVSLREAIDTLPVGKASKPIRTGDAVIVLMICEREDLPVPDTTMSRKEAENRLLTERLGVYARQEIRKLRRAAYIEIR